MYRTKILALLVVSSFYAMSQNDVDAIRYSRNGVGGSSRFVSMGGAFGAVGADLSTAAFNPAGLGVFRKGEINFSGALRITNNTSNIYNTGSSIADIKFAFNNFGMAYAWNSSTDPESRHVIAFNNSQVQNFSNSITMSGYTNNSSILKDMKSLADFNTIKNLNPNYEGLAYDTYLLDDNGMVYNSLVDTKRSVLQTRDIVTKGRTNELNFSYAYSFKDKFYFGASIGVPRIEYTSTTTHYEVDDKDSMRIEFTDTASYTTSYVDGLPNLHLDYDTRLGFNSLAYTEYFKTTGSGINLKLGGIMRVTDAVRVGMYYHTPTIYFLNDSYYNSMSAAFDKNPKAPIEWQNPEDGGYFEYKLITPARLSANAAFIIKKMAVIAVDYEFVNYRGAKLLSDKASDFAGVNKVINDKYTAGHNLRVGGEVNVKPVMLRAGYIMSGSPFGEVFSGEFVRHTVSLGIGFRTKNNWYFDFHWNRSFSNEDYYLFSVLNTKAKLNLNTSSLGATIGIKF